MYADVKASPSLRNITWKVYLPLFPLYLPSCARCQPSVSITFHDDYAYVPSCGHLMSIMCQDVPGSPPAFRIVWEVEPGNEANALCCTQASLSSQGHAFSFHNAQASFCGRPSQV